MAAASNPAVGGRTIRRASAEMAGTDARLAGRGAAEGQVQPAAKVEQALAVLEELGATPPAAPEDRAPIPRLLTAVLAVGAEVRMGMSVRLWAGQIPPAEAVGAEATVSR